MQEVGADVEEAASARAGLAAAAEGSRPPAGGSSSSPATTEPSATTGPTSPVVPTLRWQSWWLQRFSPQIRSGVQPPAHHPLLPPLENCLHAHLSLRHD